MQLLVYVLVNPFIWFLSVLPLRVLHIFSDFLFVILYHIIGYRKKVVRNNLRLSFPDKSSQERLEIECMQSENYLRKNRSFRLDFLLSFSFADRR